MGLKGHLIKPHLNLEFPVGIRAKGLPPSSLNRQWTPPILLCVAHAPFLILYAP